MVWAVALSQDGCTLVTGSADCTARVWDMRTGETVRVLQGHTSAVTGVAISSRDPFRAVTSSYDETARVWDLRTGEATKVTDTRISCLASPSRRTGI
jgi:WD40 repeat protein